MLALIRAELLKLRTIRSTWWLLAGLALWVAATAAMMMGLISMPGGPLDAGDIGMKIAMSSAGVATLFTLLIGVLAATGEFHHNTATVTFLITPGRAKVLLAKVGAVTLLGLGSAVLATAVTLAVTVPWLSALGFDIGIFGGAVAGVLAGSAASTVLFGLLGVGIGAAIRNQVGAVIAALVFVIGVEGALSIFLPNVAKWLPSTAGDALAGQQDILVAALPVWGGALVLIGWAAAAIAAGTVLVKTRDLA